MRSLRIIVVMIEPPLPFGDASARRFYFLLKGLVERGHRVTAFASCSKAADIQEATNLFPAPEYDLRCYAHDVRHGLRAKWETFLRPHSYLFSGTMRRDVEAELAKPFDVLHLEQLWSGWLGIAHASRALLSVHYLPSIDLAISSQAIRDRSYRLLAIRGERKLLHQFPRISTLTPRLAQCVNQVNVNASVYTVPLGLDLTLYEFAGSGRPQGPPTVSLIGSFNWLPTRSASIRILARLWPVIRVACPDAVLRMVGRNARSMLTDFNRHDLRGVSIEENVADILPYFRATDVLLYPAHQASGMKVKVLEAFALGTPVVTTSEGVEGLPARDGVHAGIADDDAGLIQRTVDLLHNPGAREHRRAAARQLVEHHCCSTSTLDCLEAVYAEMVTGKLGTPNPVSAITTYDPAHEPTSTLN